MPVAASVLSVTVGWAAMSCGPPTPTTSLPARLQPSSSPTSAASAGPAPSVANEEDPGRLPALTELAATVDVPLSVHVRPVPQQKSAFLSHSDALGGFSFVRHIGADQKMSTVRVLADRHPVTVLETNPPLLVSSRGEEICFESVAVDRSAPTCHRLSADFALLLNGKPVLLEQRPVPKPEAKPKPRTRKRKRAKKKQAPQKPMEMRVWVHRFDATGARDGEAIDSGLVIKLPLPGMGVIAAAEKGTGARLLHYAHLKSKRDGRRFIPQAKLASILLGADGKVIRSTRRTIYSGDRGYGHIKGHRKPRLFGSRVLVGRYVDDKAKPIKTGWEVHRLGPVRKVPTPNAVVGVDPWRLATPTVVGGVEMTTLREIYDAAPRLAVGQPSSDPGRVAWVGDRGYFLQKGRLARVTRDTGAIESLPHPFVAKRSRVRWATMLPSGGGLAQTSADLVEVLPDGTTRRVARSYENVLAPPVRIGSSWWGIVPRGGAGSGGAVVKLDGAAAEATSLAAHAFEDSCVLVGGAEQGMFIAMRPGSLVTYQLTGSGAVTQLHQNASSYRPGVRGVMRPGGGALLVGSTAHGPMATAIGADGRVASRAKLPFDGSVVATNDGAIVVDGERVMWLAADGKPVAQAPWPRGVTKTACLDGEPARTTVPSPTPGKMERVGKLAGGHCWSVPIPTVLADGTHRWLGTAVTGLRSRAVLANLKSAGRDDAAQPVATGVPAVVSGGKKSPCPPDMVSIGGRFCIDRFESQLIDATSGSPLSPDYPATPGILGSIFKVYAAGRWTMGDVRARAMPLPPLLRPRAIRPKVVARSRVDVRPSGFMTWHVANEACKTAGKRLCSHAEWVTACRGEQDRKFPYGKDFAHRQCNVWRYAHPAASLHGNAAIGHLDPRLNRVQEGSKPLMRVTGATPTCASRWGDDAVFDMVGNLDEWVDHKKGAFAGGFYSRTTKKGCGAFISAHPKRYLDYSLGTRCCAAAK